MRKGTDAGGHWCMSPLLFTNEVHAVACGTRWHTVLRVGNQTIHTTAALRRLLGPVEVWTVETL